MEKEKGVHSIICESSCIIRVMKKKKKCTLFVLFCLCVVKMGAQELTLEERLTQIEQGLRRQTEKQKFMPQIHGILRGKYEYEPDLNASRFEVRNARLSG